MIDPMRLNLRHLETVAAAARLGTISAASKALHVSQPAATQAIVSIEKQLGHRLLDRQPSGIEPTEAGQLLIVRIERALSLLERGGLRLRRSARLAAIPNIERRITLGQLQTLMAVDEAGSFALAASRSRHSQAALHRSARELEDVVGVSLLTRQGRTVVPTPAARRFLRFVRLVRAELEAGIDELNGLSSRGGGRIRIGTMPVSRAVLLPQALARFTVANVDAQVRVVEGSYPDLLNNLRHGELDVLLGALRDPLPIADVVQEGMYLDGPIIVGRTNHPLAHEEFSFARLQDFPWIVTETGTPGRLRWERMFASHGIEPPKLRVESGSLAVIRGLLLEGDWLTLLSPDQMLIEARAGLLTRIADAGTALRREIGITTRSDWRPTRLQAAFIETFRQVCGDWSEGRATSRHPFHYA
ncbi:transcriptional regulator /LysR family transcriptional regulator [Novosphingobium sp. PhB55]|uniref:LysR family transcriptional regulator n=1 Tax=Novosphingobium sp. PhB55 TaxID=2485106 RepID=UPI00106568B6|nr:LysR family transcriptional regulator [Novosphingobium sp. PhB55]TDW64620.1 transcriptional regulator /LysR family transcriptional regulator [Novosphingobium sp. PhB55]